MGNLVSPFDRTMELHKLQGSFHCPVYCDNGYPIFCIQFYKILLWLFLARYILYNQCLFL